MDGKKMERTEKNAKTEITDLTNLVSEIKISTQQLKGEHIKRSFMTEKFVYYASNKGYIIEVDIETRERNILKFSKIKNELYFKDNDNKLHRLATTVLKAFKKSLPLEYTVIYKDNNELNCSLDNLIIKPKTKQIIF